MNVLILIPAFIPSNIISILKPLRKLEKEGFVSLRLRPENSDFYLKRDISWCDVAVFSRSQSYHSLKVLCELKKRNKKIIYDIDDNFFEIPLNTKLGQFHRSPQNLFVQKLFYQYSDLVHVYNPIINIQAKKYSASTKLMRSYFDSSLVSMHSENKKPSDQLIKIAYATGRIDDPRLERVIFTAIKVIAEKYCDNVEFHFWGNKLNSLLKGVPNVLLNKPIMGYESFIRKFNAMDFDIGLAPVLDEVFFQSKTNNKYREYGGCLVAGIYSDLNPYKECVIHRKNGFLVNNSIDAWVDAMETLIESKALRQKIQNNAREDVLSNYTFGKFTASFKKSLIEVVGLKEEKFLSSFNQENDLMPLILLKLDKPSDQVEQRIDSNILTLMRVVYSEYYRDLESATCLQLLTLTTGTMHIILNECRYCDDLINLLKSISDGVSVIVDLGSVSSFGDENLNKVKSILALPLVKTVLCNYEWLIQHEYLFEGCNVKSYKYNGGTIEDASSLEGKSAALLSIILEPNLPVIFNNQEHYEFNRLIPRIARFGMRYKILFSRIINRISHIGVFCLWRLGWRRL